LGSGIFDPNKDGFITASELKNNIKTIPQYQFGGDAAFLADLTFGLNSLRKMSK
jgi:Ca2+-binding EF-hand superfamily protein